MDAPPQVEFQYTGQTRLIVIGPVTGVQYVFRGPGARVMVHARDQWSLEQVPKLSRIVVDEPQP